MEKQLWVECVDNGGGCENYLTVGKKYQVIRHGFESYSIIDDTNERRGYIETRFKLVNPPQEVESESESNEVKSIDPISQLLKNLSMNAENNPGLMKMTFEYPEYTLTYKVNEGVVVIEGRRRLRIYAVADLKNKSLINNKK